MSIKVPITRLSRFLLIIIIIVYPSNTNTVQSTYVWYFKTSEVPIPMYSIIKRASTTILYYGVKISIIEYSM